MLRGARFGGFELLEDDLVLAVECFVGGTEGVRRAWGVRVGADLDRFMQSSSDIASELDLVAVVDDSDEERATCVCLVLRGALRGAL